MISHGSGVVTTCRIMHLNTKGWATLRVGHFIFDCFMFFLGIVFVLCVLLRCVYVFLLMYIISFCCMSPPVYLDFIDIVLIFLSAKNRGQFYL